MQIVPGAGVDWSWALHRVQRAGMVGPPDPRARLERARSFLHRHAHEEIDLDRVAREAAFSRFHFQRAFRKTFGVTPHQYLTQRRIAHAQELLLRTDLSITEVCLEVGYASLGSFSALFQRHVGHPPSRYRRRVFASAELRAPAIPACFLRFFACPS